MIAPLLSLVLLAVTPPNPENLLEFESPAVRVPVLFEKLSRETGIPLRANAAFTNEVVAVRFDKVRANDALENLAQTLGARWDKLESGWWLVRKPNEDALDLAMAREASAKRLQAYFDRLGRTITGKPFGAEQAERIAGELAPNPVRADGTLTSFAFGFAGNYVNTAVSETPAARAIYALLRQIGAHNVAAFASHGRVVFATSPNRMQRALPPATAGIVRTFLDEQRRFAAAWKKTANLPEGMRLTIDGIDPRMPEQPVVKTILSVESAHGRPTEARLALLDAEGRKIGGGMLFLSGGPELEEAEAPTPSTDAKVKISELSRELAHLWQAPPSTFRDVVVTTRGDGAAITVTSRGVALEPEPAEKKSDPSAEWRARMQDIEAFEPLSTAPSDLALGLAQAKACNLVAWLPDDSLGPSLLLARAPEVPVDQVEAFLGGPTSGTTITRAGDWLFVRPQEPVRTMRSRVDRKAFSLVARATATHGVPRLDDLAAYARSWHPEAPESTIDTSMLAIVDRMGAERFQEATRAQGRRWLQLFAMLTPAQREAARLGQPLLVSNMTLPQQEILRRIVFDDPFGPFEQITAGPPIWGENRSERTEKLPNGIPGTALLSVTSKSSPCAKSTTAEGVTQFMDAGQLGMQMARSAGSDIPDFMRTSERFEKFVMGERTTWSLELRLLENYHSSGGLEDLTIPRGGVEVGFDALPEEFKNQALESAKRMAAALERMRSSGVGGDQPPPR